MNIDRRQCLKVFGGSVAGIYTLGFLGGCESLLEQIENRPLRRNISTLADNDPIVEAFRDAVAQMKALPNSDRRNWTRQAQIHLDFCPHNNWYFLPWHRAYLYHFETIVRHLSGFNDFALPYWNWTCTPQIPPHFFGASNPLFNNTRTKGPTDTIPTFFTGQSVMEDILAIPDFETFGSGASPTLQSGGVTGELEGTPHNSVHGWIGGDMGAYMSPLDPIFWCHHNMVERCWWEWNIVQEKSNPSSADWTGMSLANMFCDRDGNLVDNLTVGITALYPVLSYRFDDQLLPCGSRFTAVSRSTEELREFLKKGGPSRLRVIDRAATPTQQTILVRGRTPSSIKLPTKATQMVASKSRPEQRVVLKVRDARLGRQNDLFVRAFINPPENFNANREDSVHYAGSFAFFIDSSSENIHAGHNNGNTYHIDITNTVERLMRQGMVNDRTDLNVVLTAVSINDGTSIPAGNVEISGIEVLLSEGFEP